MPPMFTCKMMLYIWHMPLHFILWHAIKLLQPINQNQSITSLFVTCHKYLLQPIKSTAQIWVVNIISMEFLHFLKRYLEGGLLSGGIMKCRFFSQAIKVICSTCMLFFFSENAHIQSKQENCCQTSHSTWVFWGVSWW